MGIRGELFSTKVSLQNRTYFFNVKENRMGDIYLNVVESKNRETGGFERQSVILFAEDLPEFLRGFDEALKILEKAHREKNRGEHRKATEDRGRGKGKGETRSRGPGPGPGPEWNGKSPPEKGKRLLVKTGGAKSKTAPKPSARKPRAVKAVPPGEED
jgi:hypothetical protein